MMDFTAVLAGLEASRVLGYERHQRSAGRA